MDEHLDEEEFIEILREDLNNNDRVVADKVAEEILHENKKQKKYIYILLLIFLLLTFFVSYVGFSLFNNGKGNLNNVIQSGSILFSFNEGKNEINIQDALPISDEIGKALSKEGEYFEFFISAEVKSIVSDKITYEISLTPNNKTLDSKYIRVYLLENNHEVLINSNYVNNFNSLKNSELRKNSKILYKKEITKSSKSTFVFKMWIGKEYEVDNIKRIFSCRINVDAY